ncbi:MAG: helix-turn-helix domain-containing protein [Treponema sp.]|nr:helix-turn-helix domain-containing protein [Treponema sp.]
MENNNITFAERLKHARENLRKLSQSQLAEQSLLPISSIAHFESGDRKPSFDNIKKLSKALNVTTDYLLGQTDNPDASSNDGKSQIAFRDFNNLSNYDQQIAADFIKMLANKDKN